MGKRLRADDRGTSADLGWFPHMWGVGWLQAALGWALQGKLGSPPWGLSSSSRLPGLIHMVVAGLHERERKCANPLEVKSGTDRLSLILHFVVQSKSRG